MTTKHNAIVEMTMSEVPHPYTNVEISAYINGYNDCLKKFAELTLKHSNDEPVAWLVPKIIDFKDARKVHFSRTEKGKDLTDDELKASIEGTVIWHAETVFFEDGDYPVTDKQGVKHSPKPLYLYQPPIEASHD